MGGSSSKSSQTITNNTINANYLNSLNKNIMNSAVETMINNASSCSSAININNSCNVSDVSVGGDFNFGGNQSAQAKVNFDCIQANKTSADMATNMMSSITAELKTLNGTDAAANLNTASQSSNKSGFASAPSNSKSGSSTNVTNNVTNETITNIENIFETNLKNNFSVETVNECIGKTNVSNEQNLSGIDVGGNANIECIQTASVEQVQNCKQLNDSISKTTQATFQELGISVVSESDTGSSTESSTTSKSENVATGPIEEAGNAVSSIIGAVGLAYLGPVIGSVVIVCVIVILLALMGFLVSQFMGSENGAKLIDKMDTGSTGFGGVSGMDGMGGVQGMGGMSGMSGMSGMGGVQGMSGMSDIFSSPTMYMN